MMEPSPIVRSMMKMVLLTAVNSSSTQRLSHASFCSSRSFCVVSSSSSSSTLRSRASISIARPPSSMSSSYAMEIRLKRSSASGLSETSGCSTRAIFRKADRTSAFGASGSSMPSSSNGTLNSPSNSFNASITVCDWPSTLAPSHLAVREREHRGGLGPSTKAPLGTAPSRSSAAAVRTHAAMRKTGDEACAERRPCLLASSVRTSRPFRSQAAAPALRRGAAAVMLSPRAKMA
mmetsp:Transcript_47758/g.138023  ORF Transcript_47758/g.138023 Transcript_47758/m.138023 type:complete len:234 (-) Transcript_47758:6-707(-)